MNMQPPQTKQTAPGMEAFLHLWRCLIFIPSLSCYAVTSHFYLFIHFVSYFTCNHVFSLFNQSFLFDSFYHKIPSRATMDRYLKNYQTKRGLQHEITFFRRCHGNRRKLYLSEHSREEDPYGLRDPAVRVKRSSPRLCSHPGARRAGRDPGQPCPHGPHRNAPDHQQSISGCADL